MTAHAHSDTSAGAHGHASGGHALKLMPFFLALLALTMAEVGLYEWWRTTAEIIPGEVGGTPEKVYAIPKFALVLIILVFTLPKAYIVMVYFMHLRFEKAIVVTLAIVPLLLVFVCVLPTLTDGTVLKKQRLQLVESIGHYESSHAKYEHVPVGHGGEKEKPKKEEPAEKDSKAFE